MAPLHMTLSESDLERSKSLGFQSHISRNGAELGHMLPLNSNGRPGCTCMRSPVAPSHLALKGQGQARSLRF